MDDLRPHLLVPETEVEYIDPTQPRGPKKEDVDHFEHGKVLSSGLQEIVDAYTKVQSAGSLSDEDIRVFEVLLPEGEKFSNKTLRDFLQGEGMKIKNVHNERCATVVTTTSRFNTLRDRVGKYRDGERINKSFRDIDSFRFPDAVDKQSPSLKARFLEVVGAEIFDVEFQEQKLTDELGTNGQMRIEQKLIAEIKQEGGEIRSEPYDIVQRIRDGRRRWTPLGEMPILSGMLFCADCGNKLYQVRGKGWPHSKEHFVCATYRKVKGGCSSHQIRNVVVERLLLNHIRRLTVYVREHEDEFTNLVIRQSKREADKTIHSYNDEITHAQTRLKELDVIIQHLYEDNVDGKIPDERFGKMLISYENEQEQLKIRADELRNASSAVKEKSSNVSYMISLAQKYIDIPELTAEIIREFISKIIVSEAEIVDGVRKQQVRIIYNGVGEVLLPGQSRILYSKE